MKKSILTGAMALVAAGAFAQGTMLVSNNNQINSVKGGALGPASGTTFEEEIAVGTSASGPLTEIAGSISPINQGFFFGPGSSGIITLPASDGVAGATVFYDVEVWDSSKFASYSLASKSPGAEVGVSTVNSYATGGGGAPPAPAGPLNFNSFTTTLVPSPEPATLALGAMGIGSVLLFRRRK